MGSYTEIPFIKKNLDDTVCAFFVIVIKNSLAPNDALFFNNKSSR